MAVRKVVMMPERYEHYRPRADVHHLFLYALGVGVIAAVVVLVLSIDALRREVRGVRVSQEALNARFSVQYHYDPPPGWMKK